MPDITTPNASLEHRPNVTRSPTFSDNLKQIYPINNHAAKHPLTKGLITTKGWTLSGLVKKASNFYPVDRVHFSDPGLMQKIQTHEDSGVPLIIQGFHEHKDWPTDLFTLDWLNEHGKPGASARNVRNWSDFDLPLSDLIRKLRATEIYANETETERLYGKDAECPREWTTWLSTSDVIPSDLLPHGTHDYLNHLPSDVQTLMCYLGVGDTFTPFHKDLCASSGQNLMCYTENGGSSFWFMTRSSAAPQMAEYFHKMNEELDFETHVVTLDELRQSRLPIYIAEQQLGDLVLVPPRSCHQVINNGGITMKTSWSRMTLKGLKDSLYHELPIYHRVCRPETYKVKLNIYRALHRQTRALQELREQQTYPAHSDQSSPGEPRLEKVAYELHQLLDLLDDVLGEEYSSKCQVMPHVSLSDTSHQDDITCDFCGADVFQSFFECISCQLSIHEEAKVGDGIVICPLCYIEGRSCKCRTMKPTQCRPFGDLLRTRDDALHAIRTVCTGTMRDYRSLLDHPNSIISARHVGIFRAACVLYERRLRLSASARTCSGKQRASHEVPDSSYIYCKLCHNGRCLSHVLETFHTHSALAILISEGAEGSLPSWHEYHKESKAVFKEAQSRILLDEETGVRPDLRVKLVYVASKFRICKSINSNATLPGWYDICLEQSGASVTASPAKSASDIHRGAGPTMSRTTKEPSLTPELLFGRSESFSDLTSLPSDYQDSPSNKRVISGSSALKSRSTGQLLLGGPLAKSKSRRVIMDCVILPHPQRDRTQEPVLPDRLSSSMVSDYSATHSRSMSDDEDAFRPLKRQRFALPSDELLGTRTLPLRLEKRASDGAVFVTNKPRSPERSIPNSSCPAKKTVEIQAVDEAQAVLHQQLDLALTENDRLRVANEELEDEICHLQKRNEELITVAQRYHAQYRKMRDGYRAPQGLLNPCSVSVPVAVRHQEGTHPQGSLTRNISHAEAPPTEPHVLQERLDEPSSDTLDTRGQDTNHAFQFEVRHCFAGLQDTSHHSQKGGSLKDMMPQPCAPSDENSRPEAIVADPTEGSKLTLCPSMEIIPSLVIQSIETNEPRS